MFKEELVCSSNVLGLQNPAQDTIALQVFEINANLITCKSTKEGSKEYKWDKYVDFKAGNRSKKTRGKEKRIPRQGEEDTRLKENDNEDA